MPFHYLKLATLQIYLMLNPQDKQKTLSKKSKAEKDAQKYRTAVLSLHHALQKTFEQRSQTQHQAVTDFLDLSPFFQGLITQISAQFAKNIVTSSKIYYIHGKKRICEEGQRLNIIIMPLMGNIFVTQQTKHDQQHQNSLQRNYLALINGAKKHLNAAKLLTNDKKCCAAESSLKVTAVPHWNQLTNLKQIERQGTLMLGGVQTQRYTESIYVKGQGWFLGIQSTLFKKCLTAEYERRIMAEAAYFRQLGCFDMLTHNQLKVFIQRIQLISYKKDDFIYKEGEIASYIFLLIEGEVKASKTVSLFKEDPNLLYERTISSQKSNRYSERSELQYVNFQGVFNYSAQSQRIELGILSPITIFGQEQLSIGNAFPREVDIQVTSTKAKVYRFTLKDLESLSSIHGKKIQVEKFMSDLFQAFTQKRILARRQILGLNLQLQNRKNMNYFFLESVPAYSKRYRPSIQNINKSLSNIKPERPKSAVKPRYDNLNFNEFLEDRPSSQKRKVELSQQQRRIARLTHNSSEIIQKVAIQSKMFMRLESYKHDINVVTPLFDMNYFRRQRKEALRIENKRRMNKIVVAGNKERPKSTQTQR